MQRTLRAQLPASQLPPAGATFSQRSLRKSLHCYMGLVGFLKKQQLLWLSGIELLEKTQLVRAGHSYNRTQLARNTNDAVQKYTSFKAVMISTIEGIQCLYERAVVHSNPFRFPANGGSPTLCD